MTEHAPCLQLLDQLYDLNADRSNAHNRLKPLLQWLTDYPDLVKLGMINDDLVMTYKVKELHQILSKEGLNLRAIERGFKHLRPYHPFCIQNTVSGSNNDWKVWRFDLNRTTPKSKVARKRWGFVKTKNHKGKRPREIEAKDQILLPEPPELPEPTPKKFSPVILPLDLSE